MASIYDRIREAARKKEGYVDPASAPWATPGPIQYARPQFNPRPSSAVGSRPAPRASGGQSETERLRALAEASKNDGFGAGGWADAARDIFGGVITVADALKSGYQTTVGEIGDLVSNIDNPILEQLVNAGLGNPFQLRGAVGEDGSRDSSFDFGDISLQDSQFLERADWTEDLPGPLKGVVGLAGDVVTDPLTYLTAGTVKAGTGVAAGVGRRVLAQDLAEQVAKKEVVDVLGKQVADDLVREAGTRGLGALTTKGLRRIGTSADDLVEAGINLPDFRYTAGVGKKARVTVAPRRVAEASEDFKGMVKNFTGRTGAGKLARRMAYSSKTGERELVQEIMEGGAEAPTAALALAMMRQGRGEGYTWMYKSSEELKRLGLKNKKPDDYKRITWELENLAEDEMSDLAKGVRNWFRQAGTELQGFGVTGADGKLLGLRSSYVPHRLTEQAMQNADMPAVRKYLRNAADRKEAFQNARDLDGTIDEINDAFKRDTGLDFNLLEDDVTELVGQYLNEGKDAIMRSYAFGERAQAAGLVSEMDRVVNGDAVKTRVGADVRGAEQYLNAAVKARRKALDKAVEASRKVRKRVADDAVKAREVQQAAQAEVKRLTVELDAAKSKLDSLTAAAAAARRKASSARGAEKGKATKALKAAEAKAQKASKDVEDLTRIMDNAEKDFGRHAENLRVAEEGLAKADQDLQFAMTRRQAMNDGPFTPEARTAVKAQADAEEALQAQERMFADATESWQTGATTNMWLAADKAKVVAKAERTLQQFDEHLDKLTKRGKVSAKGKAQMRLNAELRERVNGLMRLVDQSGEDVSPILRLEVQAHVADMQAAMRRTNAEQLTAASVEDIMNNPRWQDLVSLQASVGHSQIGDTPYQVNTWYKNAMEKMAEFQDPATRSQAWQNANKAIRGYRKALGWWKGYAVATPGFHLRNMYSGGFGMYIDGVTVNDARRFDMYRRRWAKDPAEAKRWATDKWDDVTARQLDEAVKVTAASGWGITAQEASGKLVGERWTLNPLNANEFIPTRGSQMLGEAIEAGMRGGHAFSVIRRGGSFNEALERVTKFHFNYRDISEFDEVAKMAMPFWTFFSRNMALQAQVWARNPGKLNRSYFNLKRNMEFLSEEDADGVIPDYLLHDMGGIRTPWGGEEGGRMYITPDLPSVRFQGQMEDPLGEVIGGLTPALKAPLEALTNTNQFTGREYRNSLTTWSDEGEIPRLAPGVLQLPGLKNVVDLLPGTRIGENGQLLMTDRTQAQLEGFNPMLGRANRLFPNMPRQQETRRQAVGGFFGAPIRWNDPGAQAGEQARRDAIVNNQAAALALDAKLKELTS